MVDNAPRNLILGPEVLNPRLIIPIILIVGDHQIAAN
jgi:hypothetical protein